MDKEIEVQRKRGGSLKDQDPCKAGILVLLVSGVFGNEINDRGVGCKGAREAAFEVDGRVYPQSNLHKQPPSLSPSHPLRAAPLTIIGAHNSGYGLDADNGSHPFIQG